MKKPTVMLVVENFGSCNMRCSYCFPEHMWQREGFNGAMPEDLYRRILEETFASSSAEEINVRFAGGEPLLAGREWLEMALHAARDAGARHGKRVAFSLQTNATLVTPELARFLADNGVITGVSLDGDAELNDPARGHTERTLRGFRHLAAAFGRRPGVIVTVTKCNARHMSRVVDYVDGLGVALFRANQMGATASWNTHYAPDADEWLAARKSVFEEVAARRGRILEHNLAEGVSKLVTSLLQDASPFGLGHGCCDVRCPAGRGLMYFDQKGNAYPCPRSNVTPAARIANLADQDFQERWDSAVGRLDDAMAAPPECRRCPAQFVCDYGCHAFNVAQGNFFEVNCDATKGFFGWLLTRLDDVARIYFYVLWRSQLKAADDYDAVSEGVEAPAAFVEELSQRLRSKLAERLSRPDISMESLQSRYGRRRAPLPVLGQRGASIEQTGKREVHGLAPAPEVQPRERSMNS